MQARLLTALIAGSALLGCARTPASSAVSQPAAVAAGPDGVVPLPEVTLPRTHEPRPTSAAISAKDLMTRLYIYADDSMQGREAGTIGNVKATNYIASEIARIGLEPAGENGTYFQTVPVANRSLDPASSVAVDGTALELYKDWIPTSGGNAELASVPVIYGGVLNDSATLVSAEQARGKLVVLTVNGGLTSLNQLRRLPPALEGAAGLAVAVLDEYPPAALNRFKQPRMFLNDNPVERSSGQVIMLVSNHAGEALLGTPLSAAAPGTPGASAHVSIKHMTEPVKDPARNVVGIIRGSDPALRGEYVAVGAHNDHIGFNNRPVDHDSIRIWNHTVRPEGADDGGKQASPEQQARVNQELAAFRAAHPGSQRLDSISNGADDDGSGTVTVLELAQKIAAMKTKPKRSILFVWHVGEEKGLWGSHYFTDHPTVPRDSIVAQLNMDMVGRGDAYDETGRTKDGTPIHGNPNYLQLVGSRRLSTELGDMVETVNREGGHNMDLDYSIDADGHPSRIYCRSDHYEYARYGIPIVFFTTGLHSDYHQVTDEPQYIDYDHMARVANFLEDLAVQVADMDHRPVVDKPKPDPNGRCVQ
jgi:hypothetical protein